MPCLLFCETNPVNNVIKLLNDLKTTLTADEEAETKEYIPYN